jgi:hypothetical protein
VTMSPTRAPFPRRVLVALTMLLALGAGLLVSAGSAHHATDQPAAATASTAIAVHPADHEHHHGGDWTPTLSQALRPCAAATILRTLPAGPEAPSVPTDSVTHDLARSAAENLARLGILRV